LVRGQSERNAAGVYGHTLVDKKTGESLFRGGVTLVVKGAG
jgi:hypothetical protein